MSPREEGLLRDWVAINLDILVGYWDGAIEYTEDALDLLQPLPA